MGLASWVALTVIIFLVCTRFSWDDNKYAFFRLQAMFIPQSILYYYVYFWIGLNGFSVWRIWFCHDWDAAPVVLAFYIIKIMMISFVAPSFMLTTKIWIPIFTAICAFASSIVCCVLFSIKDRWAGACGVVDIITMVIILIVLIDLSIFKKLAISEWNKVKDKKELFVTQGNDDDDNTSTVISDKPEDQIPMERKLTSNKKKGKNFNFYNY